MGGVSARSMSGWRDCGGAVGSRVVLLSSEACVGSLRRRWLGCVRPAALSMWACWRAASRAAATAAVMALEAGVVRGDVARFVLWAMYRPLGGG